MGRQEGGRSAHRWMRRVMTWSLACWCRLAMASCKEQRSRGAGPGGSTV